MAQNNLELMRTLDDAWNAQDWETFEKRHSRDTAVFWPGQAEPTRGRDNVYEAFLFPSGVAALIFSGWMEIRR